MEGRHLSKTTQRGLLYLTLIIAIVVILIAWPAPADPDMASTNNWQDTMPEASNDTSREQRNAYGKPMSKDYDSRSRTSSPAPHRQHSFSDSNRQQLSREERERMYHPTAQQNKEKREVTVELNHADTLDLQMINGIGPAYARRIVRYRERIGGFYKKEQLLEVYGFTPELLKHISSHITIDADSLRRIDINNVSIKELMRHPYVDAYQARDIIAYRNKGHRFQSADDLRMIVTLDDSIINKILPYITFDGGQKAE